MGVDERILKCVKKGLTAVGESVKQVVYYYMESEKGLKPKDIPNNPEEFVKVLKRMFGIGGSVLEKA